MSWSRGHNPHLYPQSHCGWTPLPPSPSPQRKNSHIWIPICGDPHGYIRVQIPIAIPT